MKRRIKRLNKPLSNIIMFELLTRIFVKDHKNTKDLKVREAYGTFISIFSIFLNIVLVTIKLIISFITNSISIRTDALNNLSDVGSNIATLFGFKLANKHADKDHPYGHGRMEYISGMIVAFLIVYMGITAFFDSLNKIIHPEEISFSYIAILVLLISISIKLLMFYMNKKAGKLIESETLLAACQDSLNDSIMTFTTLLSLVIYKVSGFNLDAIIGLVVSVFILKSGAEIFSNVMSTILGKAPDKELIKDIEDTIMSHPEIHGIHDLMLHDYGLSQRFLTLHAEIDCRVNIMEIHDEIDNIEREILNKFNITTTIHMDPIDFEDEDVIRLSEEVKRIVKKINPEYNIHDFRIVKGNTHTNIVFDCVIPSDDHISHQQLATTIEEEVNKLDGGPYYAVIEVEHSYV